MKCPFCSHGETKVVDKRESEEDSNRRRRECLSCGKRFTTYEKLELSSAKKVERLIKRDGRISDFDTQRIESAIFKAAKAVGGSDRERAKKVADEHLKMTLDTEHVGMWKRYFQKMAGENEEQFNKRFNGWYMDQIKKMDAAGIIGHIHIADGFGYGHANLPAGHGDMPVVDAIAYLKKKGYKGAYLSEGYGDASRMLRETWKTFGSSIYGSQGPIRPGAPERWSDVQFSYFGRQQSPYYVFGAYSPSNDWTLWTQVPLE